MLSTLAPAAPFSYGHKVSVLQVFDHFNCSSRALLILAGLPLAFPKRELVSQQQLSHDLDNRLTESEVIYGVRNVPALRSSKCAAVLGDAREVWESTMAGGGRGGGQQKPTGKRGEKTGSC